MYHGWTRRRSYFEGWYFKVIAPEGAAALAFIPGIAMEGDGRKHAFIQVLDGQAVESHYYEFPASEFRPADDRFELRIGNNFFSPHRIELHLPDFEGALAFSDPVRWPRQLGAPGIMGWYSFVPFMETYHDIVSMDHRIDGRLRVQGSTVDFTNGKGYIEKDWGTSFPSSWIWMQSNHLESERPASLFFSVARIPWLGSHFVGYISGLLWEGRLYQMATYTGAKLHVELEDDRIFVRLSDRRQLLEISGQPGPGAQLQSPLTGQMTGKVQESLQGRLTIRFEIAGKTCYNGPGLHAGLEVSGPVAKELIEPAPTR